MGVMAVSGGQWLLVSIELLPLQAYFLSVLKRYGC
jgi:hypothetical protein